MASSINPNNIDGSYPVAGQDNNSQGFRDNFTNIKVNFQYAEEEINDLEAKSVLKVGLGPSNPPPDNNMGNKTIYAVNLNDVSTTRIAATGTSGTVTLNYASGQYQTVAPSTGSSSLAFTNFPDSGYFGILRVQITVTNLAYTVTLPGAVTLGTTGIQGYSGGVITFAATGTYVFDFSTSDGGTTVTVNDVTRAKNVLTNPLFLTVSEDLAASAAASLTKTLAAGSDGQIKVFAMVADTGDMVITVANAGWKSSGTGTITFDTIGDACTLMYTNAKWFCIGNNGVTFA